MSAVVGLVHWDGQPVEAAVVRVMSHELRHRGQDGMSQWQAGPVGLGQCTLRTTPEQLHETLPLANEDSSLVLVMDGRVDNAPELRRELLGKGARLRSVADAELVLRAYETWGEDCCAHIVGECVFFVWDARRQCLFGARDAAGVRNVFYHAEAGRFAFASETRALLSLPDFDPQPDPHRLLDYLITEFDRTDQVSSFYQGISRLPAGHALRVNAQGLRTWRWWNPATLEPMRFASLQECTEAFMAELESAIRPRLRSIKPVGAMLSGGLDSSTLVGLISQRMRGQLALPLRTVSLIRDDRENCRDWASINTVLEADPWLVSTVLTTARVDQVWPQLLALAADAHDPFALGNGLTYHLTYQAASEAGCGVLLDGMAGDMMFHDGMGTLEALLRRPRLWGQWGGMRQFYRNHDNKGFGPDLAKVGLRVALPNGLRGWLRNRRDVQRLSQGDLAALPQALAWDYLSSRRTQGYRAGLPTWQANEQADHAQRFTSGLNSFGHETYGPLALACGVEPRSPYSDRRLIEFAIRMPLQAKLAIPWYKHLLRAGTQGMLPEATRLRRDIGSHPGWTFYERLALCAQPHLACRPIPAEAAGLPSWFMRAGATSDDPSADSSGRESRQRAEQLRRWLLLAWFSRGGS